MKTLDEVIACLDGCGHIDCDDCPYHYEDEKIEVDDCAQAYKDALFYLKEYRDECNNIVNVHDDYIVLRNEMAEELNKRNPPLDWNELKQMKGKPVWVENIETQVGRWIIIANFTGRNEELACMISSDRWIDYWKKDQGETWQAYRIERRENESQKRTICPDSDES